jgi:AcrR family transcriptional regulator
VARPEKPLISRRGAIRAALAVIDSHGLERFGLDLVAQRMGVKAPSLYYHFKNKADLLSAVVRTMLGQTELPPIEPDMDWREAVIRASLASWKTILRHPNAAPLLLRFYPRHIFLDAYEHWFKMFSACGVPVEWHITILEGAEKLTFGSALFAASSRSLRIPPLPDYDPALHPDLEQAVRYHPFDEEQTFAEALRCFLRGLPALSGMPLHQPGP